VAGNTNAPDVSGWTQIIDKAQITGSTPLAGLNADLVRGLPADFTSSKAANGYQKLPSGVILQWGRNSYNSSDGSNGTVVSLPIAFPNAYIGGVGSDYGSGVNRVAINGNTTSITLWGKSDNSTYATTSVSWLVFGY